MQGKKVFVQTERNNETNTIQTFPSLSRPSLILPIPTPCQTVNLKYFSTWFQRLQQLGQNKEAKQTNYVKHWK